VALLRVYTKMDSANRIALPRGIRKALDIKPDQKLELTLVGFNKVKKLVIAKERGRYIR
jgi:bifunctional DNA-binding transcriptional regulator/antitoxin component of YhaV-PrlF toxin-antitoxin module